MEKRLKEIRLSDIDGLNIRADGEAESVKMILEGYPIVFNKETLIHTEDGDFYEKIDPRAFDKADMSDVCLRYNHNDDFFILARTRNKSLTLKTDDKGVFMHAELIDTTTNRDVYKMVNAKLLTQGSFAFTVADDTQEVKEGTIHRTIKAVGMLFDVAICPYGAYGDLTDIYARSYNALESVKRSKVETLKNLELMRLRNANKLKLLMEVRK